MEETKKVVPCELVAKHVVIDKDDKHYDFYSLSVKYGRVEVPIKFDKRYYQLKELLTELVVNNGK